MPNLKRGWSIKINGLAFVFSSALIFLPLNYITPALLNLFRSPSEFARKAIPDFLPTLFFTYAIISIPAAFLLWKVRPSTRARSYAWALLMSIGISGLELILGVFNFLAFFLYFGVGSLLIAPILTYNLGPILWAFIMGELRWRTAKMTKGDQGWEYR